VLNESNCEFIPGLRKIKTTRLIKEGEELMFFYEMLDIDFSDILAPWSIVDGG
jgi:hypothetical protein